MRNGTINLFGAVEPKAGQRTVSVTERRSKVDFVAFVRDLVTHRYAKARRVHLVLDNLNIHDSICNARLTRGSRLETPRSEPSSGRSPVRTRI